MKQTNFFLLSLFFLFGSIQVIGQIPPNTSVSTAVIVDTFPFTDTDINTSLGGSNILMTGGCVAVCCSTAVYRVEIPTDGTLRVESSLYTPFAGTILGYTPTVPIPVSDSQLAYYSVPGNFCSFRDTMVLSDVLAGDVFYVLAVNHNNNTGAGANSDFIFSFISSCEETTSTIDTTTCNDYLSPSGNYTWTSTGTYADTIPKVSGCDSVITINLTVNYSNTGTDVLTACDSYTWIDGLEYTVSNDVATHTLTNATGCDSLVTLNLTVNYSNTGTDVLTACDSYTWIDGLEYTESNDAATHTLTNVAGCDSVVTLNLTVNYSNTGTDVQTACDSYTWIDELEYTESNDVATHTLTNAIGCDSVVTLNLTVNYSNTGTDVQTACDSYTWIDGLEYTESNDVVTYTLTNAAGCDSVVTLDLTIINNDLTITYDEGILAASIEGASYQWVDCNDDYSLIDGATEQSYIPTENGNFAMIISKDGCVDTTDCVEIINVGLENLFSDQIQVYPNPSNGQFQIDLGAVYSEVSYEIRNTTSQLIEKKTILNTDKIELSINTSNGIYYIHLYTNTGEEAVIKMIKQ